MPDFERILDSLTIHIADTPEEIQYAKGFIAGKNKARFEIIYIAVFILILAATIFAITF